MRFKKPYEYYLTIFLMIFAMQVSAQEPELKPFVAGSYLQLLKSQTNQPFMLVAWSITCPSCLKDMPLLSLIHKKRPDLHIILLAADDISEAEQIRPILEKHQLSSLENWVYADENTQKLQFEIDPKWYGELPRTYFFDKAHQRTGISGVLSEADYDAHLASILK
jgi:thiol-disulfide isomerase/thioredoxin